MTRSLAWIAAELDRLRADHLHRELGDWRRSGDALVSSGGREWIDFGSNDYLGLAHHPRIIEAVRSTVRSLGWGAAASPLVDGHSPLHRALEERIAHFEGCEAAVVFPTGFAANQGTIDALVGADDAIFSNADNHASIVAGSRLSRARIHLFDRTDLVALEDQLRSERHARRRLIVTDGLFSMDGDLAPLDRLAGLADCYNAMLMVDEAHATGTIGPGGRGSAELFRVEEGVDVRVGTLSKALGGVGGFVAGSAQLVAWLVNRAQPLVFSTAPPAAACAAALAALDIILEEPDRRERLQRTATGLRDRLSRLGWNLGRSTTHVVPVIVGSATTATALSMQLREQGLFVPAIRPPSVAQGTSRLRISLSAAHTESMVDRLVEALTACAGGSESLLRARPAHAPSG